MVLAQMLGKVGIEIPTVPLGAQSCQQRMDRQSVGEADGRSHITMVAELWWEMWVGLPRNTT